MFAMMIFEDRSKHFEGNGGVTFRVFRKIVELVLKLLQNQFHLQNMRNTRTHQRLARRSAFNLARLLTTFGKREVI